MPGEVVHLASPQMLPPPSMAARLENLASIFRAIDAGELLAALPDCPIARGNHNAALKLLGLVEAEILILCDELAEVRFD